MFTDPVTFFFLFNKRFQQKKMYKLHSSPASVKTEKFGVAQNFTEVCSTFMEKGSGHPQLFRSLFLCKQSCHPWSHHQQPKCTPKLLTEFLLATSFTNTAPMGTLRLLSETPLTHSGGKVGPLFILRSSTYKLKHLKKKIVSIITLIVLKTSDNIKSVACKWPYFPL